jgi:hypothetical protein
METKIALGKWLNNDATPADMQVLNAWPEFDSYKKNRCPHKTYGIAYS